MLFNVKASSMPDLTFYETSVASDYGRGCEYEAVYSMKYKPFKRWRLADNVAYVLWQQSEDGGRSWVNINGQSGVNKDELRVMVEGTENLIFRAIVVADSTETSAKKNAEYIGENGVPLNNNIKYTISRTLHSMKPEATCEYDPNYLCTRYETFGLCSARSCRYDTAIKVNKYRPGGSDDMTWGEYLICSNPDSAIFTKECEDCPRQYQFSSVKDADGNVIDSSSTSKLIPQFVGDAFAFIMMSKDEYQKMKKPMLCNLFSGGQPLCPCKTYVFYMFLSCVGAESGTRIYPKMTILDPNTGDTLATQTYFYTFKGYQLYKPTVTFMPPSDYHNQGFFAIVELDYETTNADGEKMSDYVTFSLDELAFSICGIRVPYHDSYVDKKPFHLLSNGFYCRMDDGKRGGQWVGFEEWRYKYPDAAFLWQRKNNSDSPWVSLPSLKDTFFTYSWEEGENHPMYRVLLAESAEVNRQKIENGFPDDPCAIRTEPYNLGFYCEEYKCPKTKFSFVEDDIKATDWDTTIYNNHDENLKIVLYQNNSEPIDAFYISGCETPILSESSGKKHTLYLPADEGSVTIYAMTDTCKTDSVFYSINKVCPRIEFSFIDGDITSKNSDTTVCYDRKEDVEVIIYQNNNDPIDAFYINDCESPIFSENYGNAYTLYLPAEEGPVIIYAISDTCKTDSVIFYINKYSKIEFEKIDDSGKRELIVDVKGGAGNYNYDFGDGFQLSNKLTDITYGVEYKISVKDEKECMAETVFNTNKYELEVPVSFSPDGDGQNDMWKIKNIEKFPSAEISLYDRMGKKLLSTTGADFENWDGTYLGHPLPTTDYWYEIFIPELNKTYVGHFTLYRE